MKYACKNGWSKQKILDVIEARRYSVAAMDAIVGCTYLSANGNKCAIGLFIPKKHQCISDTFAGDAELLFGEYPDLIKSMPLNPKAMQVFQAVHDDPINRMDAKQAMINWVRKHVRS